MTTAFDRYHQMRRESAALRGKLSAAAAIVAAAEDPHSLAALEAAQEVSELRLAIARLGAAMKPLAPLVAAEVEEQKRAATRAFAPRHLEALRIVRAAALAYEDARRAIMELHAEAGQAGGAGALVMPFLPSLPGVVESVDAATAASPRAAA